MERQKTYGGKVALYAILLVVVIGIMFSLKKCNYATVASPSLSSGGDTIDVAIEYSPLSIYTYNDTLGGFNYDLLRVIADSHHLNLKFHPVVTLKDALKGIEEGRYDILAAALPMTAEDQERYLFSQPVYLDRQVLVQLKDSITGECRVKSQLELAGDTVWIVEGSPIATRVSNLAREIGDTIYTIQEPLYGAEQLFLMTATGEIKQAVINERIARELSPSYPNVDISTDISFTQFQSWILNKENTALADSLNRWLSAAKETPAYKSLEQRYLK